MNEEKFEKIVKYFNDSIKFYYSVKPYHSDIHCLNINNGVTLTLTGDLIQYIKVMLKHNKLKNNGCFSGLSIIVLATKIIHIDYYVQTEVYNNDTTIENVVKQFVNKSENLLIEKGKEYSIEEDRLYNFHEASDIFEIDPETILIGYMIKHIVSVLSIIDRKIQIPYEKYNEKIIDIYNYLILLFAITNGN